MAAAAAAAAGGGVPPLGLGLLLGATGAIGGAALGHAIFAWALDQGFYVLLLPGLGAGLGCSLISRQRARALGILAAVVALAAGILSEWRTAPFVRDPGLGFFLAHLHHLKPMTLIMIALGTGIGFWVGQGKD